MDTWHMIDPNLKRLYDYEFTQTDEALSVKIRYPITFNPHSIQIQLTDTSITMGIPDQIPILCGNLFSSLEDNPKWVYEDTEATIIFQKKNPEAWNIIVTAVTANEEKEYRIDPKSSFLIFYVLSQAGSENEQEDAFNYLSLSAQYGFPPALRELGRVLLHSPQNKVIGLKYLEIAASRYEDHEAEMTVGLVYSMTDNSKPLGLQYLKRSIEAGFAPAFTALAQLLSPYSSLEYPEKDIKEAKRFLEDGLKIAETASAYHELALITLYGTEDEPGDQAKAIELQQKAVALDESTPPLPDKKPMIQARELPKKEVPKSTKLAIGLASLSLLGAFAFAMFKQIKKNSKD